jgi:hypothetical protein
VITLNQTGDHYHVQVEMGKDTKQLVRIVVDILPDIIDRFARKNAQYGENKFELGAAGQFPEIWRKVKRLRALLWEERQGLEEFEDASEVIDDLIGHLLMLKDCITPQRPGRNLTVSNWMLGIETEPTTGGTS